MNEYELLKAVREALLRQVCRELAVRRLVWGRRMKSTAP